MKFFFAVFALSFVFFIISPVRGYSESTETSDTEAEPYEENEFPQWVKDLRRYEVVSLGSVPFVAITVTLGYGTYMYCSGQTDTFPNPFDKGSDIYSEGDQMKMFCASIGIGAFIGLSDLAINLIKRHAEKRRLEKIKASEDQITVIPFQEEHAEAEPSVTEE